MIAAQTAAMAAALLAAAAPAKAPTKPGAPPAKAVVTLGFKPKTLVENGSLQVILGQRATFHLDGAKPVMDGVEEGKLAVAHPEGQVTETFAAPEAGKLAAAVDGSAEKRATSLKLWNGTDKPVSYKAVVFILKGPQTVEPVPVGACSVAPGETRLQSWPAPIVAVGLAEFKSGGAASSCAAPTPPKPK